MSDIKLIDAKIDKAELKRLVDEDFKDMVKPHIGRYLAMFRHNENYSITRPAFAGAFVSLLIYLQKILKSPKSS